MKVGSKEGGAEYGPLNFSMYIITENKLNFKCQFIKNV